MLTHLHSRWFICFQSFVFRNTKNFTMKTGPWPNKKNTLSLSLRANITSVLPPKFIESFYALCRYGNPSSVPIPLPCNVGNTLEPTGRHGFRLRSVHCSRATSINPSRRLAPYVSSLRIRNLCTPPCHSICLIN